MVGGYDGDHDHSSLWSLDLLSFDWKECSSMTYSRLNIATTKLLGSQIVAIGGDDGISTYRTVEIYDAVQVMNSYNFTRKIKIYRKSFMNKNWTRIHNSLSTADKIWLCGRILLVLNIGKVVSDKLNHSK